MLLKLAPNVGIAVLCLPKPSISLKSGIFYQQKGYKVTYENTPLSSYTSQMDLDHQTVQLIMRFHTGKLIYVEVGTHLSLLWDRRLSTYNFDPGFLAGTGMQFTPADSWLISIGLQAQLGLRNNKDLFDLYTETRSLALLIGAHIDYDLRNQHMNCY